MKLYYYKYLDLWLSCRAKNKGEVARMFENSEAPPEKILTEREAQRCAEQGDQELADYLQSTYMCALMCN